MRAAPSIDRHKSAYVKVMGLSALALGVITAFFFLSPRSDFNTSGITNGFDGAINKGTIEVSFDANNDNDGQTNSAANNNNNNIEFTGDEPAATATGTDQFAEGVTTKAALEDIMESLDVLDGNSETIEKAALQFNDNEKDEEEKLFEQIQPETTAAGEETEAPSQIEIPVDVQTGALYEEIEKTAEQEEQAEAEADAIAARLATADGMIVSVLHEDAIEDEDGEAAMEDPTETDIEEEELLYDEDQMQHRLEDEEEAEEEQLLAETLVRNSEVEELLALVRETQRLNSSKEAITETEAPMEETKPEQETEKSTFAATLKENVDIDDDADLFDINPLADATVDEVIYTKDAGFDEEDDDEFGEQSLNDDDEDNDEEDDE